jgi:hypothetical protein
LIGNIKEKLVDFDEEDKILRRFVWTRAHEMAFKT